MKKVLIALLVVFFGSCNLLNDSRSENEIAFDSLITIIKSNPEYIKSLSDEINKDDSAGIYLRDILNLPYKKIVEKYKISKTSEEMFISSISMTANLSEAITALETSSESFRELSSKYGLNGKTSYSLAEYSREVDSLMNLIWNSPTVEEFKERFNIMFKGEKTLAIYPRKNFEYINIRVAEDSSTGPLIFMQFRLVPDRNWAVEFYDNSENEYIEFNEWSNTNN